MSEWISVNDRMPDVEEDVLVFAEGKTGGVIGDTVIAITKRFYPMRGWKPESTYIDWVAPWAYFTANYDITHWMPLPEPPEEVE